MRFNTGFVITLNAPSVHTSLAGGLISLDMRILPTGNKWDGCFNPEMCGGH